MIGIIILLIVGARFRRRGNSWPKTILKTAGVYVIYLFLLYGGLLAAVGIHGSMFAPPTSPQDLGLSRIQAPLQPVAPRRVPTQTPIPTVERLDPITLPVQPAATVSPPAWVDDSGTTTIGPDGKAVNPPPRTGCDPAYPEPRTCIPLGPPYNQGCGITNERLFTVLPPDPQELDHDKDGIGCEPYGPSVSAPQQPALPAQAPGPCDSSYPDVCIPPVWAVGDLDCRDVPYGNFRVVGGDPHRLDGPYDGSNPYEPDGLGCEWN